MCESVDDIILGRMCISLVIVLLDFQNCSLFSELVCFNSIIFYVMYIPHKREFKNQIIRTCMYLTKWGVPTNIFDINSLKEFCGYIYIYDNSIVTYIHTCTYKAGMSAL